MRSLVLLPYRTGWGFALSDLHCGANGDFLARVEEIEAQRGEPVPDPFDTHYPDNEDIEEDETGYGNTQRTPYGAPLLSVRVARLLPLSDAAAGQEPQTRAAWAYLAALCQKIGWSR